MAHPPQFGLYSSVGASRIAIVVSAMALTLHAPPADAGGPSGQDSVHVSRSSPAERPSTAGQGAVAGARSRGQFLAGSALAGGPAAGPEKTTILSQPNASERLSAAAPDGDSRPPQLSLPPPNQPAMAPDPASERARQHVLRGFSLANRGATSSGRDEFLRALQITAQAQDAWGGTPGVATRALAEGLRALKEVDDFIPTVGRLAADMDLAAIVASHRCPVLKLVDTRRLTLLEARSHYYTYAETQLTVAAGQGRAASMALFGLGKFQTALVDADRLPAASGEPKAMVLFQASLNASAENFMAANELGVLLTRYGKLEQARNVFAYSVQLSPQVVTWQNLATVQLRLGEADAAREAGVQAALAARQLAGAGKLVPGRPRVQWTEPSQFAASSEPPAWK